MMKIQKKVFALVVALILSLNLSLALGEDTAAEETPATENFFASLKLTHLDGTPFDTSVFNGKPTLLNFWATWCPPCRAQGPIIDAVAKQLGDTAKVAKVNVDNAKATAQAFGVRSIPTLVVLKDGKTVKSFTGLTQADALVAAVKDAL